MAIQNLLLIVGMLLTSLCAEASEINCSSEDNFGLPCLESSDLNNPSEKNLDICTKEYALFEDVREDDPEFFEILSQEIVASNSQGKELFYDDLINQNNLNENSNEDYNEVLNEQNIFTEANYKTTENHDEQSDEYWDKAVKCFYEKMKSENLNWESKLNFLLDETLETQRSNPPLNELDEDSEKSNTQVVIKLKNINSSFPYYNFIVTDISRVNKNCRFFSENFLRLKKFNKSLAAREDDCCCKIKNVVNTLLTILRNIGMFFKEDHLSFITYSDLSKITFLEDLDNLITNLISSKKDKKLIATMTPHEDNNSHLKMKIYVEAKKIIEDRFTKVNLKKLINTSRLSFDLQELSPILLSEILGKKLKLKESKSCILLTFLKMDLNGIVKTTDHRYFVFYIKKMIIIFKLANLSIWDEYLIPKDKVERFFNDLVLIHTCRYLSKNNSKLRISRMIKERDELSRLSRIYKSLKMDIDPSNLLFIDYIMGDRLSLVSTFFKPKLRLTVNEEMRIEYEKTSFYFLIKTIGYFYDIADILINNISIIQ